MKFFQKSFTLIEMLIVIVIIGILAAALIPRLQSVQERARDTKRKADITQIYSALQIYKMDNGVNVLPVNWCSYAADCTGAVQSDTGGSTWIIGLTGIMANQPVDPVNNSTPSYLTGGYNYRYGYIFRAGKTYQLYAQLENKNDGDRCAIQGYTYYDIGGGISNCSVVGQCPYGGCRYLYMRADLGQ